MNLPKITNLLFFALLFFVIPPASFAQGQTILSELWTGQGGETAVFYKNVVKTDPSNNVYVSGSTIDSSGNHDIVLQKFSPRGILLWTKTYSGASGGDDMANAMFIDNSYNIYLTGRVEENVSDGADLVVLKYDSGGVFKWDYIYNNGGTPAHDFGTAITGDNAGYVYVTGGSFGSTSLLDGITLCLNSSNGSHVWNSRYNYDNLNDVGASITYSSSNVYVSGARQTSASPVTYQLFTISYIASNGVSLSVSSSTGSSSSGINETFDMTKDNSGNIYVVGAVRNNDTEFDFKTYKFNSSLQIVWERNFNGPDSLDDKASSVKVDNNGNVYVAGFVSTGYSGTDYALLKYSSSGSLLWQRFYDGVGHGNDEAVQLAVDVAGRYVYVAGFTRNGTTTNYETVVYDSAGNLKTRMVFDGAAGLNDAPTDITLDYEGNLLVTGMSQQANTKYLNTTVKYSIYTRTMSVVMADTVPVNIANELIVRFDTSAVKREKISGGSADRFYVGAPEDFLKPAALSTFYAVMPGGGTGKYTFIKVYKNLRLTDTVSISRLGKPVKIPPFWTSFVVLADNGMNLIQACDSLNNQSLLVQYATPNWVGTATYINDPLKNLQHSIYYNGQQPTDDYWYASVNVDSTWDLGPDARGKEFVRTGVYDSGIDYRHPDFLTNAADVNSSKALAGWDFVSNGPITGIPEPDQENHGTPVAGILGALTNNNKFIAGIAGGDAELGNTGTSLYNMRILNDIGAIAGPLDYIANAIVEGASHTPDSSYGFELHIMNHSWEIRNGSSIYYSDVNIQALSDAVHYANRNQVIFVAARGNIPNDSLSYPACYNDDWVINVGGTGDTGQYGGNGYGRDIDIGAPSKSHLIRTLTTLFYPGSSHQPFSGTSAAAPHVSGTSALLLGYKNNPLPDYDNLAPEDVEWLLQLSAYDVGGAGYDDSTGYGRLDAYKAMRLVEPPYRYIVHHGTDSLHSFTKQAALQDTAVQIQLTETCFNTSGQLFQKGQYLSDVYKVSATVQHTHGLPEQVVYHWVRNSSSSPYGLYDINYKLVPHEKIVFHAFGSSAAQLDGFVYRLSDTLGNVLGWLPHDTAAASSHFDYSVLIYDQTASIKEWGEKGYVNLYPNPTSGGISLAFTLNGSYEIRVSLFDMQGRLVHSLPGTVNAGEFLLYDDISHLTSGLYFYKISMGQEEKSIKVIKN